jgi:hypothetical protein
VNPAIAVLIADSGAGDAIALQPRHSAGSTAPGLLQSAIGIPLYSSARVRPHYR